MAAVWPVNARVEHACAPSVRLTPDATVRDA